MIGVEKIARMQALSKERAAKKKTEGLKEEKSIKAPDLSGARGRAHHSLKEDSQMQLFELEQDNGFRRYPVQPQTEFPTLLTRLPIFLPGRIKSQQKLLDKDLALPFCTPWAEGRKLGPPLTIVDEDTLIALGRMREYKLYGRPKAMPIPISSAYQSGEDISCDSLLCLVSDVQQTLGLSTGGHNGKLRLESIRRIAATSLEFTRQIKFRDEVIERGTVVRLLDIDWRTYRKNSVLYIQFSPIVTQWFDNAFTYLSLDIRKQLSDPGKALHRFLSGQPKNYSIGIEKLITYTGYTGIYKKYMARLRLDLAQLKEIGWIHHWEITGNGRSIKHILKLTRT